MKIDFDRTSRCMLRIAKMRTINVSNLAIRKMRRNDRSDRPLISRAVRLSTNIPENRTDIQTRTTANAVERISLFRIG